MSYITYSVIWWSRLVADHQLLYMETLQQQSSVSNFTKFGYFWKKKKKKNRERVMVLSIKNLQEYLMDC